MSACPQLQTSAPYPLSPSPAQSMYGDDASLPPQLRPTITRRETDHILSYYESDLAGRTYISPDTDADSPSLSLESSMFLPSDSDSSSANGYASARAPQSAELDLPPAAPSRHTRRSSVPSEGGADRRRLAIVEMDSTAPLSVARKRSGGLNESGNPACSPSMGSLLSRRGVNVSGLALMAPPDASPRTYTDLTPPTTAPIIVSDRTAHLPHSAAHHRSASEAVEAAGKSRLHRKSSRDVGIVGVGSASSASDSLGPVSPTSDEFHLYTHTEDLRVPIFQTPAKSRPPTPGGTPELSDSSIYQSPQSPEYAYMETKTQLSRWEEVVTPGIGEYKDIQQPVVGPVVVGLTPELMRRQEEPQEASAELKHASAPMRSSPLPLQVNPARSTYQHYQPGVHATAGPLPPPPRALFENNQGVGPRPRPPRQRPLSPSARRELDEIKEALQLPNSVSAALAAKVPPPEAAKRPSVEIPTTPAASADGHDGRSESPGRASLPRSIHTREGAFPPSTLYTSPPTQLPVATTNESSYLSHTDGHSIVVVEPRSDVEDESGARNDPVPRSGLELHRENSWVTMSQDAATHNISPNGGKGVIRAASGSHSSSSSSTPSRLPVPPPKSNRGSDDERMGSGTSGLRATLSNLKRFSSLPRTPSPISSRKSPSSRQSCTPSPSVIPSRVSYRPKILCAWPDAMNCQDVVAGRSALERSLGYARKINELAMYDCGLGDWVVAYKGAGMRTTQTPRQILPPSGLSAQAPQPRHTSHGSMASEATFPTRPDAYTATNLSSQTIDVPSPHTPPPSLPYPSLPASRSGPARSSTLMVPPTSRTMQLPLGTKSTGFFASISRKTSLRKEKGPLSPPSPGKVLSKRLPGRTSPNVPLRSVQVTSPPTIPGGPRAPPGRVQRSKTFSISASPPRALKPDPPPQINQRQSSVARRPSLFTRARAAPPAGKPAVVDPEFERQVEKLADLLPHADRNILAGYLRRAGQDILAIGQYLEDEKNGTLRHD